MEGIFADIQFVFQKNLTQSGGKVENLPKYGS